MLQQHNQILRRVQRKVLDAHAQIVHHEPPLAPPGVPGKPRGDQAARRPRVLQRLGEQPPDELVRVAAPREHDGCAPGGAQGSPGGAAREQDVHARGGRGEGAAACVWAWPVDEPVRGELDAILEREGGGDEGVEPLADLINGVSGAAGREGCVRAYDGAAEDVEVVEVAEDF